MGTEKGNSTEEGGDRRATTSDAVGSTGPTRGGDAVAVAHDLRTPLNVATGRLAMARESCERGSDHLDAVDAALRQMNAIIEDSLGGSPARDDVEAGESVDVEAVVRWCWEGVADGEATMTVDGDLGTAVAHRVRFSELVANLLRNAVEHGGPRVAIRVGRLPNGFYVADDGPGISPAQREHVFERGYTDADGGTGLGLHLVGLAAEAHGWTVDLVESESGGARIEVRGVEFV